MEREEFDTGMEFAGEPMEIVRGYRGYRGGGYRRRGRRYRGPQSYQEPEEDIGYYEPRGRGRRRGGYGGRYGDRSSGGYGPRYGGGSRGIQGPGFTGYAGNMNPGSGYGPQKKDFTHFISVPLNQPAIQEQYVKLQADMLGRKLPDIVPELFAKQETLHLTILMLTLDSEEKEQAAQKTFDSCRETVLGLLNKKEFQLSLGKLAYMSNHNLIHEARTGYLQVIDPGQLELLRQISSVLIKAMLANGIIAESELSHILNSGDMYYPETFHVTVLNSTFLHKGKFTTFDAESVVKTYGDLIFGTFCIDALHISTRFSYPDTTPFSELCSALVLDLFTYCLESS